MRRGCPEERPFELTLEDGWEGTTRKKGEEVRGGGKSTYRGQGTGEKVGHIPETKTSRCAAMEVGWCRWAVMIPNKQRSSSNFILVPSGQFRTILLSSRLHPSGLS